MEQPGEKLYASHKRIFVKHVWGKYQAKRWTLFAFLYGIFFLLPWLTIKDRPAVLFDIPARKFHILGVTFWPQDAYLLALLLIALAFTLFLVTAIYGRVWCGFACPQTVGTSIYLEIERLIEGDRQQAMRLDRAPWTAEKIAKRVAKHAAFIAVSAILSLNLLGYFVPMPELLHRLGTLSLTFDNWVWFSFFFALAYSDFGYFREQLCHGPCPYGRFQGVMLDPDSLYVNFDVIRGEPRQFFRKGESRHAGDCVDCKKCVDVCPAGIDIRNGPQYECISCMRCIDACATVMPKVGFETGLIRVGSENSFAGKPLHPNRPRLYFYGALLAVLVAFMAVPIMNHKTTQVDVIRNRSFIYQQMPDGRIANVFIVKALNMDTGSHSYRVRFAGLDAKVMGEDPVITAKSGEVVQQSIALALKPDRDSFRRVLPFKMQLVDADSGKLLAEHPSTFILPDEEHEDDHDEDKPRKDHHKGQAADTQKGVN